MAKPESRKQNADVPVVWLLTDNKPGHRNQLKGLGNRLRVLAGASTYWVDASAVKVPLWRALLAVPPRTEASLPRPDLVIAAGSGTHRLLLALRKLRGTRTLVLMKPGFPLSLVSGAVIPAHDHVQPNSRIFITEGVVNTITPLARITEKHEALILIGGPSSHFDWEDDVIFDQLSHLISQYPDWNWTISSSRRTPQALLSRLDEIAGLRITVVHPSQTHEDWLSHRLAASRAVWVTPDSMSMVCEAATSGVPTGLFELPARSGSRVAEGVDRLVQGGYVARWQDHALVMADIHGSSPHLWEADRAARWVLSTLMQEGQP
jgi:hypothetical protein